MSGNPSTSRCPSSPLSTLSSSSAQSNPNATARFSTEIYARAAQFSRLPYNLAPSTLPPLSPAARQRIATIQQRCIADRHRNAPEIFLASCRNWRGELPFGWPAEQRYDEDAELMLWKHDVPDTVQQLEEWRAEWRELRKSENRTSLGAPLPGSSKRRKKTLPSNTPASGTKSSKSVPPSTSLSGTELTPKLEMEDDHTVRPATLLSPSRVSSSAPPQAAGTTPQTHRSSQSKTKSQSNSKTTSSVTSQPSSSTVSIFKVSSQQQLLSFPSALASSASRNKIKQSGTLNGMQVEVEVRLSQEHPDRQKRSWNDLDELTIFQKVCVKR